MAYFDQQDLGNRISLDCWEELYSVNKNYKINSLVIQCYKRGGRKTKIDPVIFFVTTKNEKFIIGSDRLGRDFSDATKPVELEELRSLDIKDVKPGQEREHFFMLILTEEGCVLSAGENDFGQLGRPSQKKPSFVPVEGLEEILQISAGARHGLALRNDKVVLAWGYNKYKWLCGDCQGNVVSRPTPIADTESGIRVNSICSAQFYSTILDEKGEVHLWGLEKHVCGNIRDSSMKSSPIHKIEMRGQLIVEVSCGQRHVIARTVDGDVLGWGSRTYGRLGLGNSVGSELTPKTIISHTEIPIVGIKAVEDTNVAWTAENHIYVWGRYKNKNVDRPTLITDVGFPWDCFAFGWWAETGGYARGDDIQSFTPSVSVVEDDQESEVPEQALEDQNLLLQDNERLNEELAESQSRLEKAVIHATRQQNDLKDLQKQSYDLRREYSRLNAKANLDRVEKERYAREANELAQKVSHLENYERNLQLALEKSNRKAQDLKLKLDQKTKRIETLKEYHKAAMAVQLSQQREKMSQQPEEKQLEGQREEEIPSNQIPAGLPYDVIHYVGIQITDDWRQLGRNLELTDDEIKVIEYKSQSIKDKAFRVLRKWFEHSIQPPTLETLAQALRDTGKGPMADEILDPEFRYARRRTGDRGERLRAHRASMYERVEKFQDGLPNGDVGDENEEET